MLHEHLIPLHDGEILFSQLFHDRIKPVIFQRKDRALVGKALRLPAPVVLSEIAERGIVCGDGRQRKRRPELVRIEKMLPHEPLRHILRERAVIHAAQVVVQEGIRKVSEPVAVVTRALFLPPQIFAQPPADILRLFPPHRFLAVPEQLRYARERFAPVVGIAHDVH